MKRPIEQSYADIRKQIEALQRTPPRYAIAFFDLAGSTEYKARRDPTTSLIKIYRHNAEIEEEIGRHQGVLVKSLGDGVLATFEIKDAEDIGFPLTAAIRIMRTFANQGRDLGPDEQIVSRVGVTVGPVIDFASINPRGKAVQDPQGSIVDLAARLCALASPGQILCDAAVRTMARSATQEFSFGEAAHRVVKGFDAPLAISALRWSNQAPLEVSHSPPVYAPSGFLTTEFVLEEVRLSNRLTVVTGFSHRHFCDNIELLNLVAEKARGNSNYRLTLLFMHPNSHFRSYAGHITRRKISDLTPEIVINIGKACQLFLPVCDNVVLKCLQYSMIVPMVRRDDVVHFALPLRSQKVNGRLEGVVGGGWFSVHAETALGSRISQNAMEEDGIEIPIQAVSTGAASVRAILDQ